MWLGMVVPGRGMQGKQLNGFHQEGQGPARPRGVLLMLLAPASHDPSPCMLLPVFPACPLV